MSWADFLAAAAHRLGLDARAPLTVDDAHYPEWVAHVSAWLSAHDNHPYLLHLDEDAWAERAIADGTFAAVPQKSALIAGARGLTPPEPRRDAREVWIDNVLRYFEQHDEPYALEAGERAWAEEALRAGVFEWALEPLSIRPRSSPSGPTPGPYR